MGDVHEEGVRGLGEDRRATHHLEGRKELVWEGRWVSIWEALSQSSVWARAQNGLRIPEFSPVLLPTGCGPQTSPLSSQDPQFSFPQSCLETACPPLPLSSGKHCPEAGLRLNEGGGCQALPPSPHPLQGWVGTLPQVLQSRDSPPHPAPHSPVRLWEHAGKPRKKKPTQASGTSLQ